MDKLEILAIGDNDIGDLSPIAGLVNLSAFYGWNLLKIRDVRSLASLVNLRTLDLSGNQIEDISPLASLVDLQILNLSENNIRDFSPLASLTNLERLDIRGNEIEDEGALWDMLVRLENLNYLQLPHLKIIQIDALRSRLPNCSIFMSKGD